MVINSGRWLGSASDSRPQAWFSLQAMVTTYGEMKTSIAGLDKKVKSLTKTTEMQDYERLALEDLAKSKLTRKMFEIKGTKYVVKKHEINRTKPPTVKQV